LRDVGKGIIRGEDVCNRTILEFLHEPVHSFEGKVVMLNGSREALNYPDHKVSHF
jgi:hypothetical protein